MTRPWGLAKAALVVSAVLIASLPANAQDPPPLPLDENSTWWSQPNVGYGPFLQTSLGPFSSLRMNLTPFFPSSFPARTFEIEVLTGWAKNNTASDLWDIDFEVVASTVGFQWALSDEARVDLQIASGDRTGGGLDPLINGFHETFGLALGVRARHPNNDYVFDLKPSDAGPAVHLDRTDPQPFVEAAHFSFQHVLTYGDDVSPAVSYSLTFRTKLGGAGDLREASPVDLAASLAFSKEVRGFHLYAGATLAWYGRDDFFGIRLRTWQWAGLAAAEWNCLPDFSLVLQYLITDGAVDGLRNFSKPSHEIAGGFKWEISPGILFETALLENIIDFENSPDLGFHFGFTFRY